MTVKQLIIKLLEYYPDSAVQCSSEGGVCAVEIDKVYEQNGIVWLEED